MKFINCLLIFSWLTIYTKHIPVLANFEKSLMFCYNVFIKTSFPRSKIDQVLTNKGLITSFGLMSFFRFGIEKAMFSAQTSLASTRKTTRKLYFRMFLTLESSLLQLKLVFWSHSIIRNHNVVVRNACEPYFDQRACCVHL